MSDFSFMSQFLSDIDRMVDRAKHWDDFPKTKAEFLEEMEGIQSEARFVNEQINELLDLVSDLSDVEVLDEESVH